ncbi:extracellular solute-binding protein (plasmid) [Bacillus sp. F19]|nr:extracellular solute-binding protein [Bacillus sp. F19]
MKGRKFIIPILLTSLLMTGCNMMASNEKKNETTEEKVDPNKPYLVSKKPSELTIHYNYLDGKYVFNDDWAAFKKISELTNVSLKGVSSKTSTNSQEAFNLMIASGEIPNLVYGSKDDINKYSVEGAFLPLDGLIKDHAPNIQKYFKKYPELKTLAASDGKIYMIPFIYSEGTAEGYFIRQDWLDKLGLKMPETVEDYYKVLKAFKEKDPNGNGKKDEIPFFMRENFAFNQLVTLWGASEGLYIDDDKVRFGPMEKEFGEAMENLAKWYKEGLLDPEIFTRGSAARDYMLGNNIGGSTRDWFPSTSAFNGKLPEKIPGFHFVTMAPPENPKGERVEPTSRSPLTTEGIAIGFKTEDPAIAIKYLDFLFTDEGRKIMNYGIEGVTYDLKDGKPVLKEEILNSESIPESLREYGVQHSFVYHHDSEYEKQFLHEEGVKGVELYEKGKYMREAFPVLNFNNEEEKIVADSGAQLTTYIEETMQKWVLGKEKVDHKGFVEKLKKLGVEKYIDANQDAYNKYKKNM